MKLNSDELGEKGESRFKELCADAKLTCNPSSRDRTGWDFIVEFPFEDTNEIITFDKRNSALSCHIQLKTILSTTDRISVRLSTAERLAKEPKPTFIYILRVDKNLKFIDSYYFHITGTVLSKILKRLRTEQNKKTQINKLQISFKISDGHKLQTTGSALRSELSNSIGNNLHTYIDKKNKVLSTLGFKQHPITLKISSPHTSKDDIVDAFLGLKDLKISNFSSFEERFGIKLATLQKITGEGTMSIEPKADCRCKIIFKSKSINLPVVIEGEIYSAKLPGLELDELKLLIRTELFNFTLKEGSITRCEIKKFSKDSNLFTIAEWIQIFSLLHLLSFRDCKYELIPDGMRTLATGSLSTEFANHEKSEIEEILTVLENAKRILDLLNLTDSKIKYTSVLESSTEIQNFIIALDDASKLTPLSFKTEVGEVIETIKNTQMLLVYLVKLGQHYITYCLIADMSITLEGKYFGWNSTKLDYHDCSIIYNKEDDFELKTEQWKSETDINVYISLLPRYLDD
jgi:hypothetical protein